MRYDYRCVVCGEVFEVNHPMTEDPEVLHCGSPAVRLITAAPPVQFSRWGGRSTKALDRPSNREYQAYKKWEAAGGEPGTQEHKDFLAAQNGE